jgi:TonB family protein
MPLKVRKLWLSCLVLTAATGTVAVAQQPAENQTSSNGATIAPIATTPTNTVQQRIARVRAWIAGRNFSAAAAELEKIKKETGADESLQQVSRVMLMGVYLEQPDYSRAQALLEETYKRKSLKVGADESYYGVAGQIIKSSQSQLDRYKRLGLNIADAGLPAEACTDLVKWHGLLEIIVQQSKAMTVETKQPDESLTLLEAATGARSMLSRDDYEAAKWKNEVNDTRELIASAQTKVSEVDASSPAPSSVLIASNTMPSPSVFKPTEAPKNVLTTPVEEKPAEPQVASGQSEILSQPTQSAPAPVQPIQTKTENTAVQNKPESANNAAQKNNETVTRQRMIVQNNQAEKTSNASTNAISSEKPAAASGEMMKVGSLVDMATKKVSPAYPPVARTARISGIVKVEVIIGEDGKVAEVSNAAGPEMLRRAATEAVKRWQFKPQTRDGQPVRASGFVNFNFTL